MTPLDSAAAWAGRHLPAAALAAFLLLLANMYALRIRALSDLVSTGMVLVAVMALLSRLEPRGMRGAMLGWLGAAAALLLAGALASPAVLLREAGQGLQNLLLIAAFLVATCALLRAQGAERVMAMIFAAAALGATASVTLHIATASDLLARIELLGRPVNPIPAAAAAAAGMLAGFALLRAGLMARRWRLWAVAGMGTVLLALLLTQSRGPIIGLLLGAAMLLLPARRALALVPVVVPAAFLSASFLVLAEAPLRALFCEGDELLCRPSLRLPLWQASVALVAEHPFFGLGVGHPMGEGWLNNPQNAVLATGVYFGLPFLALAVAGLALLLRRLAAAKPTMPLHWSAAMLTFSAVYFAFEPSPFGFYNAHWLFLWLPVAVILCERRG